MEALNYLLYLFKNYNIHVAVCIFRYFHMNIIYNSAAQYSAVVIAAMADGNATNFPPMLLESIAGFGVSYQFVKAAQTAAERHARITTLAALFSASGAISVGSNPAANAGLGATVAAYILHMRDVLQIPGGSILARGGSLQSLLTQ